MDIQNVSSPTQITISPAAPPSGTGGFFSNGETPGFADLIDTINPLQHIPIVSSVYRALSGDSAPSAVSELAGGALFGGPLGFIAGLANVIFTEATGKDMAGAVLTSLKTGSSNEAVQLANADANTVHLGDFAGDVARSLRSRNYEQDTQVASNNVGPVAAAPTQSADAGNIEVASAAPVIPVVTASGAAMTKDQQILSLFGASTSQAITNAYQKAAGLDPKDPTTSLVM